MFRRLMVPGISLTTRGRGRGTAACLAEGELTGPEAGRLQGRRAPEG